MSMASLKGLATSILENASKLEAYLQDMGQPLPSFEQDYPPELPLSSEMQAVRTSAVDACLELHDLLVGPAMLLRPTLNATSLQFIYKYKIAQLVPLNSGMSYGSLAESCNLREVDVRRILRFAMIHHRVFQEKEPGIVCHTAASRYLVESEDAMACLGFQFDEVYDSFAHTVEALEKYKDPQPTQCGWAIAHRTDMAMWDYHEKHPELGERSARAMAAFTKGFHHDIHSLTNGYDWSPIAAKRGTVVDVGGATGHASIALARAHSGLQCVVQDLPQVVAKVRHSIPEDMAERITVLAHDFFEPQPVSADVYVFRQIFHDWGDNHCIKILRALIPALKPGVKILANDFILPPPGILPPTHERQIRAMDVVVMSLFNSQERETGDWEALFKAADPRFGNVKLWKPDGAYLGLIEATWNG